MTMFKTKEQIEEVAKEYANSFNSRKFQPYKNTLIDYFNGYTQAQQDIKEACSEGFDGAYAKIEDNFQVGHGEYWETAMANSSFLIAREAYEAGKLSSMKELQEKDEEIERLKKDSQSYYENNQKIIKSLELKEDKYQEAVKEIERLKKNIYGPEGDISNGETNDLSIDSLKEVLAKRNEEIVSWKKNRDLFRKLQLEAEKEAESRLIKYQESVKDIEYLTLKIKGHLTFDALEKLNDKIRTKYGLDKEEE